MRINSFIKYLGISLLLVSSVLIELRRREENRVLGLEPEVQQHLNQPFSEKVIPAYQDLQHYVETTQIIGTAKISPPALASKEIVSDIDLGSSKDGVTINELTAIRLIQECPVDVPACVEMSLDYDRDSIQYTSPENADGDTEFIVSVAGSLANGPVTIHLVRFTEYTGGMSCPSNVAVVGVLESGQTKLLTEAGVFLMEPEALAVGCPDCVAPSNGRSFRRVPSWDLGLVGLRREQLFQTEDGTLGVEDSDACILMSDDFQVLSPEECAELKSTTPLQIRGVACT